MIIDKCQNNDFDKSSLTELSIFSFDGIFREKSTPKYVF